MRRAVAFVVAGLAVVSLGTPARGQFGFALDPAGASPGARAGGFGYSGFGYSAYGPRGFGYYVGLPDPTASNGPSAAFSPIFNAMAAAPRDNVPLGPTFGGYEYSTSRFGVSRPDSRSSPGFTTGYGPPPELGPGSGYRSAYVPPSARGTSAGASPGFTYGYGEPPRPPRRFLEKIFGRR